MRRLRLLQNVWCFLGVTIQFCNIGRRIIPHGSICFFFASLQRKFIKTGTLALNLKCIFILLGIFCEFFCLTNKALNDWSYGGWIRTICIYQLYLFYFIKMLPLFVHTIKQGMHISALSINLHGLLDWSSTAIGSSDVWLYHLFYQTVWNSFMIVIPKINAPFV